MKIINNINESKTNCYIVQTSNTVKNNQNEKDEEINFEMGEIEDIDQILETEEIKDNINENENENEEIINNEELGGSSTVMMKNQMIII